MVVPSFEVTVGIGVSWCLVSRVRSAAMQAAFERAPNVVDAETEVVQPVVVHLEQRGEGDALRAMRLQAADAAGESLKGRIEEIARTGGCRGHRFLLWMRRSSSR